MKSQLRLTEVHIDESARDLMGKEIAERVARRDLDSDEQTAILARIGSHALRRYLPGEVRDHLTVFTATGCHALLLHNLPTWDFPRTPVDGFSAERTLAEVSALHFGLLHLLGVTPFAVPYENDGKLLRNVVANPDATGLTSSWGWDSEFFWHSDNPHLPFGPPGADPRPYVPRFLTFYGVRNTERVSTEVAAVEDALALVDEPVRHTLASESFHVGPPDSIGAELTGGEHARFALLEASVEGYRVRYDRGSTRGLDTRSTAALEQWSTALNDLPAYDLVLQPGEFLIFDNYRVLHRRKRFTPLEPDVSRWLRRCYAS